jgi:hypothetical protein
MRNIGFQPVRQTRWQRVSQGGYRAEKHHHFVLQQKERVLVFTDARQFKRVRFHHGALHPSWWPADVSTIGDRAFNRTFSDAFSIGIAAHR